MRHANWVRRAALAGIVLTASQAWAADYSFRVLGAADTLRSNALAVNDAGLVVGTMSGYMLNRREYFEHAALWDGSKWSTSLSTYEGAANAINNAGQIVGDINNVSSSGPSIWSATRAVSLIPGAAFSATGINDAGRVVTGNKVWDSVTSASVSLASLGGNVTAGKAINAGGQVAGWARLSDNVSQHATTWSIDGSVTDLGTLGGVNSVARDINSAGLVVGSSEVAAGSSSQHAALWDHGQSVDLGTLGGHSSEARALNDSGWIVGWSYTAGLNASKHATLWRNGTIIDLNDWLDAASVEDGWELVAAYDINASGMIVGQARNNLLGTSMAFSLTPVPEPSGLALGLASLVMLPVLRKGRRLAA